ncbi:MAG: hypothetical protein CMB64_01905 [Euryarchaeota archaeon]|nr:hypothetical protein [Euryarchaeota archaeon]
MNCGKYCKNQINEPLKPSEYVGRTMANESKPIVIMGAGLSGLAASIILAKGGKKVIVHDIRENSGARFDGDFQGLENWTNGIDFFDELREWGIDPDSFKSTEFHEMDLAHPDDEITKPWSPRVAFRVVERGSDEHTIDQGLKNLALKEGVEIRYKSRIKPNQCDIIAAGPKQTSAVAYGEVFKTNFPNHVTFQLNDKLAPGAYSYLIVIDGIGLICTCLWRQQSNSDRFLNETINWYEKKYPELDRTPIKRVGGKGDFAIHSSYKSNNRYYVGEAGGLQDFMWGFGMKYAITSGVFAAKDILGEVDYELEIKTKLLPKIKTSVVNRFLMNRVGDKGFKSVSKYWMKHQKKHGDGLIFMEKVYKWGILRRVIFFFANLGMLKKHISKDGRKMRRMPFRKGLKRDIWEPSERALEIGEQWEKIKREGGKVSFSEESDSKTISDSI